MEVPIFLFATLFIGLPWLVFHYITKWKTMKGLTPEDENLLDVLYETARKLDDRLGTIERIMTAENPGWKQLAADPSRTELPLDDHDRRLAELRRIQ
jgi:phage shock protein B